MLNQHIYKFAFQGIGETEHLDYLASQNPDRLGFYESLEDHESPLSREDPFFS